MVAKKDDRKGNKAMKGERTERMGIKRNEREGK
jgi:hypothetical protein